MIPKIIHYCWLSGDEYPEVIKECLSSWKKYLPDYEIWLWDTKRFNVESTLWTKQAFETKKYAFAADYIRLYALYNYGGIYLDSDISVFKSFDDLLHLPYFIGQEYIGAMEPAIIGAEKGLPWIGDVLKRYENRPFIKQDGSLDTYPLPDVFFDELYHKYSFRRADSQSKYEWDDNTIWVFNSHYFNSRNCIGPHRWPESYCSHIYAGSWMPKGKGLKAYIIKHVPKCLLKAYFDIAHNLIYKDKIHQHDPFYQNKKKK